MEATVRRAVNEIFFRDSWSIETFITFFITLIGTFLMSSAISRMAFSFVYDEPSKQSQTNPIELDETSEDSNRSDSSDNGDADQSENLDEDDSDSTGTEEEKSTIFCPIKVSIPSVLDVDPSVSMVRDVEHLKTL